MKVPFNKPYITDKEKKYISEVLASGKLCGNNLFAAKVVDLIKEKYSDSGVFLTPSCTGALEMGAMLSGLKPGDEVIMPSFTFSSTANAVMIFGAKPIFCEVSKETMNIDVSKIEDLITPRTKMIIPIDYAGVPCEMDSIMEIAEKHKLIVMLDAAQSYGSYYKGEPTGKKAHLVCFSFHETKNFSCGEGGAIIVNKKGWIERASFLQEKGTDRARVMEGLQNRYSWIESGSSYLLSDILAAMLLAQLEAEEVINQKRSIITAAYKKVFLPFVQEGLLSDMVVSSYQKVNHHAYWILFDNNANRNLFMRLLEKRDIPAYIGYVPLHSSKMGRNLGYAPEDLSLTDKLASRLVRMPIYADLEGQSLEYVVSNVNKVLVEMYGKVIYSKV